MSRGQNVFLWELTRGRQCLQSKVGLGKEEGGVRCPNHRVDPENIAQWARPGSGLCVSCLSRPLPETGDLDEVML